MTEKGEDAPTPAGDAATGIPRLPHAPPGARPDIPGEHSGGPWWWERPRSCALDVTLAVLSAAECVVKGLVFARQTGVPVALTVLVGLVAGATLLLRRRWPIAVVLVSIAIIPAQMGYIMSCVGLYTLATSEVRRRVISLLAGLNVVGVLVFFFIQMQQSSTHDFHPPLWFKTLVAALFAVVLTVSPLLLGLYVAARRRLVESLRERADGLERELSMLADRAEERAEWARQEERNRIAREMHDVVAHRVSLMVVHAAALQAVALKDPEKASGNAALIGDMGRQALTELRTMVGVLRTAGGNRPVRPRKAQQVAAEADEPLAKVPRYALASTGNGRNPAPATGVGSATAVGASDAGEGTAGPECTEAANAAELAELVVAVETDGPGLSPTLAQLDALIGQSRTAGMTVELSVEGKPRRYASRVERTAYRVVQEALTNVHKHAAGATTRVRLAHRTAEVAVLVENEPPAEGAAGAGLPSGGNGLVGMKERVTALGGGFVSGPTDHGGYRVSAILPDEPDKHEKCDEHDDNGFGIDI